MTTLTNLDLPFVPNTALAEHPLSDLLPLPNRPVHIDLGTGLGHFLEAMAGREVDANWIGLENDGAIFKRAARRVKRAGHQNTLLFMIDARPFLLESVPPESLDHIWINFPDPWPKKKHAPRRHSNPWMLQLLVSRLRVGGELHLATDVPDYLEQMTINLTEMEEMTIAADTSWQRATLGVETKYERKWRSQSRPLYYNDWQKRRAVSAETHPFDWQSPPNLYFRNLPEPGFYGEGRYFIKVFGPRRTAPRQANFIFIDQQTGVNTPGVFDTDDGGAHLRGAWTSWKIYLLKSAKVYNQ